MDVDEVVPLECRVRSTDERAMLFQPCMQMYSRSVWIEYT